MKTRRAQKLIDNKLQFKLALWIAGIAGVAMLFQFMMVSAAISQIATDLPHDSEIFLDRFFEVSLRTFLATFAFMLSAGFVAGILLAHRVAGPIHSFTQYLKSINAGLHPSECKIRRNDELQDFCELLNQTTAPLRFETPPLNESEDQRQRAA